MENKIKRVKWSFTVECMTLAFMLSLIAIGFLVVIVLKDDVLKYKGYPSSSIVNFVLDISFMIIGSIVYGDIAITKKYKTKEDLFFQIMILLVVINMFNDIICWVVQDIAKVSMINMIFNFFFYSISYITLFVYFLYIREEQKNKNLYDKLVFYAMCLFLMIIMTLQFINCFVGFFYKIDFETGHYERTDFYLLSIIYMGLGYAAIVYSVIRSKPNLKKMISLLAYFFIPIITALAQALYGKGYSLLFPSCMLSLLIIYINVQSNKDREIEKNIMELENQKVINIVSQVQPHFIYNVLTSIYYLVDQDQEEAKAAIAKFSKYLRASLDVSNTPQIITLKQEIEYCKLYIGLEQIRFEDKFDVIYDIKDDSFLVPRFCVQPLVENAIKHGLAKKKDRGVLTISSRSDEWFHYITVEDNGVGFDQTKPLNDDVSHIGVNNIKFRVENFVYGKLAIKSQVGVGTKCIIMIPINKKEGK